MSSPSTAFFPSLTEALVRILLPPFFLLLSLVIFLASFGKSLGVRRIYVKILLKIFEFTSRLAREDRSKRSKTFYVDAGSDSDEEDGSTPSSKSNSPVETAAQRRERLKAFTKESRHNVISRRDNLLLIPDRAPVIEEETSQKEWSAKAMAGEKVSAATLNSEFELEDILDYIKTGIGSVIEDEVTQRFVAEELKTWNLLTRTQNMNLESANFKLTVIWVVGFVFRYFVLLPGRIVIFVVGIAYMMGTSFLAGLIPSGRSQRAAYSFASITAMRIITRAFSCVITYHNRHFMARSDGICVANHTTPIDVFFLNCDRAYALLLWMALCMLFVGRMEEGEEKKRWHHAVYTSCFQILGGAISAVVNYHNPENKPSGGICVANHTSPIDVLIVACDNAYALIGQQHSGFLGQFQAMLSKCASHIWFERSEAKDRELITQRLREHVEDPNKLPILIFPEGTCINNTSVMQFKKGSFEVGGVIYPVAIKYDMRFGDAFWNSSEDGMLAYIFKMMTSWAIVADVWYLPPMTRAEGEDAIEFANRVKAEIARKGGLVDLVWDGNLKRASVKPAWKEKQQQEFSKRLKKE